jgi:hypothetical protein
MERFCEAGRAGVDNEGRSALRSGQTPSAADTDADSDLAALIEAASDWQVDLLRRRAGDMADALDRAAMRDIESARDWRWKEEV